MPTRLIRHESLVRTPWKNGGGTTAEVAAYPEGAGFDGFSWRISMADVASDGPFSIFPGIDRTLVLIEGQGVELIVEGASYRLDAASPRLSFAGEAVTTARLIAGPIRDLNVMSRRGSSEHAVEVLAPGTTDLSLRPADTIALVAWSGPVGIVIDDEAYSLDRLDVLLADKSPPRIAVDRTVLLIRLGQVRAGGLGRAGVIPVA